MSDSHRDIFVNMSQVLKQAGSDIKENTDCHGVMCRECPCNTMGMCEILQVRKKIEVIVKRCDEFIEAQENE